MRKVLSIMLCVMLIVTSITFPVRAESSVANFSDSLRLLLQKVKEKDIDYSFTELMWPKDSLKFKDTGDIWKSSRYQIINSAYAVGPAWIISTYYELLTKLSSGELDAQEREMFLTIVQGLSNNTNPDTTETVTDLNNVTYTPVFESSKTKDMTIRLMASGGDNPSTTFHVKYGKNYDSLLSNGQMYAFRPGLVAGFTNESILCIVPSNIEGIVTSNVMSNLKLTEEERGNISAFIEYTLVGRSTEAIREVAEETVEEEFFNYISELTTRAQSTITPYERAYIAIMSGLTNGTYYNVTDLSQIKVNERRRVIDFGNSAKVNSTGSDMSFIYNTNDREEFKRIYALISVMKHGLSERNILSTQMNDYEYLVSLGQSHNLFNQGGSIQLSARDGYDIRALTLAVRSYATVNAVVAQPTLRMTAYYFEEAMKFLSAIVAGATEVENNDTIIMAENEFVKPVFFRNIFFDTENPLSELVDAMSKTPVIPNIRHISEIPELSTSSEAIVQYYGTLNAVMSYFAIESISGYTYNEGTNTYSHAKLEDVVRRMNSAGEEFDELINSLTTDEIQEINITVSVYKGLQYLKLTVEDFDNSPLVQQILAYGERLTELNLPKLTMEFAQDESFPLGRFINLEDRTFHEQIIAGIALSVTYTPFVTNLYSPDSVIYLDKYEDFIRDYFYKFGFNRKLLFKDVNLNSVSNRNFDVRSSLSAKPVTLKEFLDDAGEMSLYLDPSFYNEGLLIEQYGQLVQMETTDYDTTEETGSTGLFSAPTVNQILKDRPHMTYYEGNVIHISRSPVGRVVQNLDVESVVNNMEYNVETALLPVKSYYNSAPYRNIITDQNKRPEPVFESSDKLINRPRAGRKDFGIYLNHILRNNISKIQLAPMVYLDYDKPIYMDTFGNIVTESGFVVIPSISNASLFKDNGFDIYNTAFLSTYNVFNYNHRFGNSNEAVKNLMAEYFYYDEGREQWLVDDGTIGNIRYTFSNFKNNDKNVLKGLIDANIGRLNANIDFNRFVYVISEVMRGAPIEAMNMDEFVNVDRSFPSYFKLSAIHTLTDILDFALRFPLFMMGQETLNLMNSNSVAEVLGILILIYLFIFTVFLLLYVFREMNNGTAWYWIIFRGAFVLVGSIALLIFLPTTINSVKIEIPARILSANTVDLAFTRNEQEIYGGTVGLNNSVSLNNDISNFLIKVEEASIDWPRLVRDAFNRDTNNYNEYVKWEELTASGQSDLIQKGNSIYIDVQRLFDSRMLQVDYSRHFLRNWQVEGSSADFYLPYFYVYDAITSKMNVYNLEQGYQMYTLVPTSRGNVTKGLLKMYIRKLMSGEEKDPTGLRELYSLDRSTEEITYEEDDIEATMYEMNLQDRYGYTQFWAKDWYTDEEILKGIEKIEEEYFRFLSTKIDFLDNSIDESTIEALALFISLEHNKQFGMPHANSIELFGISPKMIIMTLMTNATSSSTSELSFEKVLHDKGSIWDVLLVLPAVFQLMFLNLVNNVVLIVLLSVGTILSIFRYIKQRDMNMLKGLLYTLQCVLAVYLMYAFSLKATLTISNWFNDTTLSLIVLNATCALNIYVLNKLAKLIFKDIENLGFHMFEKTRIEMVDNLKQKISHSLPTRLDNVLQRDKGYRRELTATSSFRNMFSKSNSAGQDIVTAYENNTRESRLRKKEEGED